MINIVKDSVIRITILTASFFVSQFSFAQTPGAGVNALRKSSPETASATAEYVPMTQSERLRYYLKHTYSVESVLRSAAGAAILQGTNTPGEWGQGSEGYVKRFANSYGQHLIRSTIMDASASLLHEDNRYFRSKESGLLGRLNHAVASTFLARRDDGTTTVSVSRIGSYAATAFISREWQPPSTSTPAQGASAFCTAVSIEVGFNVAREFFPRIFHSAQ
jgi:hypothetical protein